jgi:hypothetical protein
MNWTERMRLVAHDVVAEVGLQPPFTARDLIQAVQAKWEMPIELHAYQRAVSPLHKLATGWCMFVGDTFHIFYYAGGSVVQRERIIYHELGHVVLNHVSRERPERQNRAIVTQEQERLAEAFAEAISDVALFGDGEHDANRSLSKDEQEPYSRFMQVMNG